MKLKFSSILSISILLFSTTSYKVNAEEYSENHQKVKKLFQSDKEAKTKDAIWTTETIFKVGVIDDGSKRNGYASYVCHVLYDYGFKGKKVYVQVIDIVKLSRDGEWIKLGQSFCE